MRYFDSIPAQLCSIFNNKLDSSPKNSFYESVDAKCSIEYRCVQNFEELLQAFHLVYEKYLECGYTNSKVCKLRYSMLQLLPSSQTFVALANEKVIGTGTMVIHSEAGLPSSYVFGNQFEKLLSSGRSVVEGTLLACSDHLQLKAHQISQRLFRQGIRWCISHGIDDFCVVVNPKHVRFWHEKMGFEVFSEYENCKHVQGAPGILLRLDLQNFASNPDISTEKFHELPIGDVIKENIPSPKYCLTQDEALELMLALPEIVSNLSPKQRSLVQTLYPEELIEAENIILGFHTKKAA